MVHVSFVANLEGSPAGVRDPPVFFGLTFFQQCIADGTRKWNINRSVPVNVSDLCFSESEFFAPEPMWVNGDIGPGRNLVLQPA